MNGSASPKNDTTALERQTLERLLSTPPQPKTSKKEKGGTAKKRGRPPKKQDN